MSDYARLDGELINLTELDAARYAQIWDLYENHPRRKTRMPFACIKHGSAMTLRRLHTGRLILAHYPGEGHCQIAISREPEGLQHRNYKRYLHRAAQAAGFTVTEEYSTGNRTRLDVAVAAPNPFGLEVQFSPITTREAKARTTRSFNAGWPPLWLPGSRALADRLAHTVPAIAYNDDEVDFDAVPVRGSVAATSLKRITRERCTPSSRWNRCPVNRRNFCGDWHPYFGDALTGWTLDDAIAGYGDGALVIHQDRAGVVRVVPADEVPVYTELTGLDGAFAPGTRRAPPSSVIREPVECAADRPTEMQYPPPARNFPDVIWITCEICPRSCCHPDSIASGICRGCFYRRQAQLRRATDDRSTA
jgi:hypothetical protein